MYRRLRNATQRPLPCKYYDTKDEIDDLENRNRLYSTVEVLGEKVPEDLRPEEAMDSCSYLIYEER